MVTCLEYLVKKYKKMRKNYKVKIYCNELYSMVITIKFK